MLAELLWRVDLVITGDPMESCESLPQAEAPRFKRYRENTAGLDNCAPRRYRFKRFPAVKPAAAGCERRPGDVPVERLSREREREIACDDTRQRRVHPALSDPRAAARLSAHPVLRHAFESQSKTAAGTMSVPAERADTRSAAETRRIQCEAATNHRNIDSMLPALRQRRDG